MSLDTFNPPLTPSPGTSEKPEIKILKADFGDGYTQATRDGLNNIRRVVTLKWDVLTVPQVAAIRSFFDGKGGCDPFFYTIPGETTPIQWTCEEYDESYAAANLRSMTATLRQNFNLV